MPPFEIEKFRKLHLVTGSITLLVMYVGMMATIAHFCM